MILIASPNLIIAHVLTDKQCNSEGYYNQEVEFCRDKGIKAFLSKHKHDLKELMTYFTSEFNILSPITFIRLK